VVSVCDERGRPLSTGLGRWLTRVAPAQARGLVNIAVVSDARVRRLNRQYRRLDAATDVLSFPADTNSSPQSAPTAQRGHRAQGSKRKSPPSNSVVSVSSVLRSLPLLGDIVIAHGVARRQARQAGHDEATELRVLALHGLLHLLGYDHERDTGQMARLERRLRRQAGLPGGLIERAT
jgi:probable rRNA maturation factor